MPDPSGRISHTDEFHRGQSWHRAVRCASTGNLTLSSGVENGDTIDGVTLVTGDRVLLKSQTAGAENGIYVVNASGAPTRASDMDQDLTFPVPADEFSGAFVYVVAGTANGGKLFRLTNSTTPTLGVTALTFTEFTASMPQPLATTDSPEFAAINLGHPTDTTLTRVSAGVVAIEGTNIVKAGAATSSGLTMATARVLGRTTASTGAIEELTVGSGLSLSGGVLDTSGGGSGTLTTVKDEGSNLSTAVVSLDFVGAGVTATGTTAVTVTIPGGGGGGWTQVINESGSSVANWTARDGTWGTSGGVIQQTNTGAAEYHLQYTASLIPLAQFVAECEVWIPSANSTDDYIGLDLGMNTANTNGTNMRVYLKRSGTSLAVATYQGGAETGAPTVTVNTDTWYLLRLHAAGNKVSLWIDGTLKLTRMVNPSVLDADGSYFGLFTALSTGQFRNIKLWTPDLPT